MLEPPARISAPAPRPTVPVAVLLVVVLGAFAWGLAMYALGHGLHADRSAGERGDAAEIAMSQLTRIDQALAHEDARSARLLLAQYTAPAGATWTAAATVREQAISRMDAAQAERAMVAAARDHLDRHLHLISESAIDVLDVAACSGPTHNLLALGARAGQGPSLLLSRDGGRHWLDDPATQKPGDGEPVALVHASGAPLTVVLGVATGRCAWSTADGEHFAVIHLPEHQGDVAADGRCIAGGDGSLVAVMASTTLAESCRSSDGGATWQTGLARRAILAVVPTATGTLIIARSETGLATISQDGGATYHDPESGLQAALQAPPFNQASPFHQVLTVAGQCLLTADSVAMLVDEHGRLVQRSIAYPGSQRPWSLVSHPEHAARWYALAQHALWRSDDAGAHWRIGLGRLADLRCRCLLFSVGEHSRLLLAGEGLWAFEDEDAGSFFDQAHGP
jgi:hypothetical protein